MNEETDINKALEKVFSSLPPSMLMEILGPSMKKALNDMPDQELWDLVITFIKEQPNDALILIFVELEKRYS